jgi:hypothetical protein
MKLGILFFEADDKPIRPNQQKLGYQDIYPTGRWIVVLPEALSEIFPDGGSFVQQAIAAGRAAVHPNIFQQILPQEN